MAKRDYSEDLLIQAPTAELLHQQLGWQSVFAQDEGPLGPDSLLGRSSDTDFMLFGTSEGRTQKIVEPILYTTGLGEGPQMYH